MGFFDRFAKKDSSSQSQPAPAPSTAPVDPTTPLSPGVNPASASTPPFAPTSGTATPPNVKSLLIAAREKLEAKDLAGAVAIYEEILATAGDRPDVLVTISGDLGTNGHVAQIAELIAPRYDAEKHGPATGLNVLQAYLALRNTTAAQHLLDVLFGLQRPELEQRLYGFSNALGELLALESRGELQPPTPTDGSTNPDAPAPAEKKMISLVSISRPIWSYGLEQVPGLVPPAKQGKLRRIAFGQLALLGTTDFVEKMKQPEDEITRFTRGLPLWFAETFYFSPHYAPIAAIGMLAKDHFAIFPSEWTTDNIRQLVNTATDGLDYVFTGALKHNNGDFELLLRVWEVKKLRERKQFSARWTPATADAELLKLHEQIRLFMEWQQHPGGPAYAFPASPTAWCDTLGISAATFLADKSVLPKDQIATPTELFARAASHAATSEKDTIAWLTIADRATRLGLADSIPSGVALTDTPATLQVREALGQL
ncbi:MAG: hypothetical protein QM760_02830 [Nibricoccus sp.]